MEIPLIEYMKEVSDQMVDGLVLMEFSPDPQLLRALQEGAQELNKALNLIIKKGEEI